MRPALLFQIVRVSMIEGVGWGGGAELLCQVVKVFMKVSALLCQVVKVAMIGARIALSGCDCVLEVA